MWENSQGVLPVLIMFSLRLYMICGEEKLDTTSFDIEREKLKQPVGDRPLTGMLQTRSSFSKAIIITKLSGSIVAKSPVVQVEAGLFMVQTQAIKALVRWLFRSLHTTCHVLLFCCSTGQAEASHFLHYSDKSTSCFNYCVLINLM